MCCLHGEDGPPEGHGAPEGNKNAVGNAGGGAPEGNKNALRHGLYADDRTFWAGTHPESQAHYADLFWSILTRTGWDATEARSQVLALAFVDMARSCVAALDTFERGMTVKRVIGHTPDGEPIVQKHANGSFRLEFRASAARRRKYKAIFGGIAGPYESQTLPPSERIDRPTDEDPTFADVLELAFDGRDLLAETPRGVPLTLRSSAPNTWRPEDENQTIRSPSNRP